MGHIAHLRKIFLLFPTINKLDYISTMINASTYIFSPIERADRIVLLPGRYLHVPRMHKEGSH